MNKFCGYTPALKSLEEIFGSVPAGGFLRAPNLVLLDPRIAPEAKLLFLHLETLLRARGQASGAISFNTLARLQGCEPRTVRRQLDKIRADSATAAVPLVELSGPERLVRTFHLLPLSLAYLDQSPDFPRNQQWSFQASFQELHGAEVAQHGFTPVPHALLQDARLSPAARVLAAILLFHQQRTSVPINFSTIGSALGIRKPDAIRVLLKEIDQADGATVPWVHSSSQGNAGRLYQFQLPPSVETTVDVFGRATHPKPSNPPDHAGQIKESTPPLFVQPCETLSGEQPTANSHSALPSSSTNTRGEENTLKNTALRVCADWRLLRERLTPISFESLWNRVPDKERLLKTLDIIGHQQEKKPREIYALPSYILKIYEQGAVPEKGYRPWSERYLAKPEPLIEPEQPELYFLPERARDHWLLLPEIARTRLRQMDLTFKEKITEEGKRALLVYTPFSSVLKLAESFHEDLQRLGYSEVRFTEFVP